MTLSRPLKVFLSISIALPLLVVIFIAFALFWPTTPLPIEDVFLDACGVEYKSEYDIRKRPHSYSMAPQGVWYDESGEALISKEAAEAIYNQLTKNGDYKFTNGIFEKFIVGKVLANCEIDLQSGQVKYKYVLW